jgi:hypothetical protein
MTYSWWCCPWSSGWGFVYQASPLSCYLLFCTVLFRNKSLSAAFIQKGEEKALTACKSFAFFDHFGMWEWWWFTSLLFYLLKLINSSWFLFCIICLSSQTFRWFLWTRWEVRSDMGICSLSPCSQDNSAPGSQGPSAHSGFYLAVWIVPGFGIIYQISCLWYLIGTQ